MLHNGDQTQSSDARTAGGDEAARSCEEESAGSARRRRRTWTREICEDEDGRSDTITGSVAVWDAVRDQERVRGVCWES